MSRIEKETERIWLLSDVSYSDECRTKKYFQYAENMFPLFFAILKYYVSCIILYELDYIHMFLLASAVTYPTFNFPSLASHSSKFMLEKLRKRIYQGTFSFIWSICANSI